MKAKTYALLLILLALSSGCTILLPAHTKSNEKADEKFYISYLNRDDYCRKGADGIENGEHGIEIKEFWDNYSAAYGADAKAKQCDENNILSLKKKVGPCIKKEKEEQNLLVAPIVATAAVAAVGLATDYIKGKMEEEKSLYTAQYSAKKNDDGFWTVANKAVQKEMCFLEDGREGTQNIIVYGLSPNYIGFKAARDINKKGTKNAAEFYYGFKQSSDQRFMQIRPLSVSIPYAKAKVLSNELFTWIPPVPLAMKLFKIPDETIDLELATTMEAYWIGNNSSFDGPKTIASFKTNINGYSMNSTPKLVPKDLNTDAGWLLAPPISGDINSYNDRDKIGNTRLTLSVIERDTSEATKIIDTGQEWLSRGSEELKLAIDSNKKKD